MKLIKSGAAILLLGAYFEDADAFPAVIRPAIINIKSTIEKVIFRIKEFDIDEFLKSADK